MSDRKVGVCSWSLQAAGPDELVQRVRACGLSHLQIALDPIREGAWDETRTAAVLADAGIEIVSGMMSMRGENYSSLDAIRATGGVRPTAHWASNLDAARGNAALARRLGVDLVTFHAGFLPHERGDELRGVMLDRLNQIADAFGAEGVRVAFETGQESAPTLLDVLGELGRDDVGVNFDPANMLLYDMGDPVEALDGLAGFVRQIHVKDAIRTKVQGEWGEEVPAGTGEVDWRAFFDIYRKHGLDVDLVIEREAGSDRVADVRTARALVAGAFA